MTNGSGHATRMLLLGAVAFFGPINGYQIRRELISWEVERWANVNPGSIYHGLASLTRDGLLRRHDLLDGTREVAVYESTETGRTELERAMVEALERPDLYDRTLFTVAFSQLPLLPRDVVEAALERRHAALSHECEESAARPADGAPPHARRVQELWLAAARAELGWLGETRELIRSGELPFTAGEDWGWQPADDDPGWQMVRDRRRYEALLGR